LNIEVLNCSKRGYGATLNHGISQSEVEWVTYADADGTYNPRDAVKLVKFAIENNADLVLGSRMKGVMEPGSITLFSRLGTPIISLLIKKLFRIPLTDCNSGIRCLRRSIYDSLKMASTGMEFASELVIKTAIMDLKYFEIPVNLRRCPSPDRKPHIRILRDGLRHLGIIILLFVKNLRNNVK